MFNKIGSLDWIASNFGPAVMLAYHVNRLKHQTLDIYKALGDSIEVCELMAEWLLAPDRDTFLERLRELEVAIDCFDDCPSGFPAEEANAKIILAAGNLGRTIIAEPNIEEIIYDATGEPDYGGGVKLSKVTPPQLGKMIADALPPGHKRMQASKWAGFFDYIKRVRVSTPEKMRVLAEKHSGQWREPAKHRTKAKVGASDATEAKQKLIDAAREKRRKEMVPGAVWRVVDPQGTNSEIHTCEANGRFYACAFHGRAKSPGVHHYFPDAETRSAHLQRYLKEMAEKENGEWAK